MRLQLKFANRIESVKHKFSNIFFFILVFTYVFSTVGVCVIKHYCDGELEKVSLFSKPESCCDGEDQETEGCCKDDEQHVSFHKDFTFDNIIKEYKVPVLVFKIFNFETFNVIYSSISDNSSMFVSDSDPPNLVQQDIVSHSVIRI